MNGNGHPTPAPAASFDDHPCLSALASCSGLVPCEPCRVALGTWCMPKALHAAAFALEGGQEPAAQAAAFFAAFENARAAMIESIRNAAVEHEAKLAATREALRVEAPDLSVPAPSPAPSRPRATPAAEAPTPQTMPVKKPKKSSKAAVAEAEAALDELFSEAVSASSTNSSSTTPSEEKASP